MSVLEGGTDFRKVFSIKNPYGDRLAGECVRELHGATDITVNERGTIAYIAGQNRFTILGLEDPKHPVLLSELEGIGSGRQIEVHNGLAFITSRPDGLFICDVKNPENPVILCHYDTLELATGVCASGDYCFVTCRHMGVETIDVSDPYNPVHMSNVLAGEAQSVFVDNRYLYVGAWMNKEIHIFDIADPAHPKRLSTCPLDGFGDGLFVRENICFAATGHHAGNFVNRRKYAEYDFVTADILKEGFGGGHGLEIFDVSDKANPRLLSRLKTPPLFFSSNDMWDVIVSADHAFLADTYNGLFVVNIKDVSKPFFEGYKRLGVYRNEKYLPQPSVQQLCNPATGIAVIKDSLLAVSPFSGLHVIDVPEKADVPVPPMAYHPIESQARKYDDHVVFHTNGQVHSIAFIDTYLIVAAGDQGIFVLNYKNGYHVVDHIRNKGTAMDLKIDGQYLYAAEGSEGFAVYRFHSGKLVELSRYKNRNHYESVRQVVLFLDYHLAALHIGNKTVAFIDIQNPEQIVYKNAFPVYGNMYYKNIVDGLLDNRFAAAVPLSYRTVWFDLHKNAEPVENGVFHKRDMCPIEEGVTIANGFYLTIFRGKYYFSQDINHIPSENEMITVYKKEADGCDKEIYLSGWPRLIEGILYIVNRMEGEISRINIDSIQRPVFIDQISVRDNPEDVICHDGAIWVPCGHGGLYRYPLGR